MRPITKNDFSVWKEDPVTQQFLADVAERLDDERKRYIVGTADEITRVVHARNEAMKIFEEVLNQEE